MKPDNRQQWAMQLIQYIPTHKTGQRDSPVNMWKQDINTEQVEDVRMVKF